MVITVMGRDGSGKSNVSAALSRMFAAKTLTAVIDTDLTMPTTIMPSGDVSLGNYLFSGGRHDLTAYLHQDMHMPTLFKAGTCAEDDIYSYETYLSYSNVADTFLRVCAENLDNMIVDLSGQRVDPFLPPALVHADRIIVLATCDAAGVNYLHSIKRLLADATQDKSEKIMFVATKVMPYQDVETFEQMTDCKISAVLPYNEDIIFANTLQQEFSSAKTRAGLLWKKGIQQVFAMFSGGGRHGN